MAHAAMYEILESLVSISIIAPAGVLLLASSVGSSECGWGHPRGPPRKIEHLVVPQAVELLQIIPGGVLAAAVVRSLIDRRQQIAAVDVGEERLRPVHQKAAIRTIDMAVSVEVEAGGTEALAHPNYGERYVEVFTVSRRETVLQRRY